MYTVHLIYSKDEGRLYSDSNTKARASYLCYEKKTDIRERDAYKDDAMWRNDVEAQVPMGNVVLGNVVVQWLGHYVWYQEWTTNLY